MCAAFFDERSGLYKQVGRMQIMKKMLFIYNPNAGTGTLKPKLSDVLDVFTKAPPDLIKAPKPLPTSPRGGA